MEKLLLILVEVERTISFERGFPVHRVQPDSLIHDDPCEVTHLEGRGPVVAVADTPGVVNIVRHAQHLTGIQQVTSLSVAST